MINQLIDQHRLKKQQQGQQQKNQQKKQQPVNIFEKDKFFLIAIINLILLTVRLSIFNIFFLLTFITSCLKFYKTYLMEKHVDQIEIAHLSINPKKRSIFIHYLAKFISDVLTQKDLKKNIGLCLLTILGYVILRLVSFNWILIGVIDFQYLYWLKKRWQVNKQAQRKRKILENLIYQSKIKVSQTLLSTKQTTSNSYYSPHFPYQNLKPIGESFGEINMQKSIESIASQNFITHKDIAMSMIQEEQESEKFEFDDQLPQSSSEKIKITGQKKSLKKIISENQQSKDKTNKIYSKMVQHKQSLIDIYENDSQSIQQAESQDYEEQNHSEQPKNKVL